MDPFASTFLRQNNHFRATLSYSAFPTAVKVETKKKTEKNGTARAWYMQVDQFENNVVNLPHLPFTMK